MLFCEKYWAKQLSRIPKDNHNKDAIKDDFHIFKVNMNCLLTNKTQSSLSEIQHYIKTADMEFKQLDGSKEDMIFWRGINKEKSGNKIKKYLYEKLLNLKKDDIYIMRNYAYATENRLIAESYKGRCKGEEGILIKMHVPKGAQYSKKWYEVIFPRYSKWICLNNQKMGDTTFIELKYNLPDT